MNTAPSLLGIDIGGTRIKAVRITADGAILRQHLEPSVSRRDALTKLIRQIVQALDPDAQAIGICAPGIAARDGRSIAWMQGRMQVVEGFDWRELGYDVWVLNDAHAATIAEAWIGAAREKQNVLLLTLGTGVGGGIVLDGKLYTGATGRAGHLGHVTVNALGVPDIVGMPGSLENALGDHSIAVRSGGRFLSTMALVEAAGQGDTGAAAIWQQSLQALAVCLASLINCFDPEVIVLGGGIAEAGPRLLEPLAREMEKVEWRPWGTAVPIVKATLGELAGAIGAARFAHRHLLEKP